MAIVIKDKAPESDAELVRRTMLTIIADTAATASAKVQASKVLLSVGQENPLAAETVDSLYQALQDGVKALQSEHGNRDRTREDVLLDALRDAPKGITRPDAADLLECAPTTAYNSFRKLASQGRASSVGRGRATRWVAVTD